MVLAFAVIALMALNDAEAAGQGPPKCGDTITTDTTLHHNLVNCPNNGIIIGADDVTLDLNYHRIDGDGTPAAGCDPNTQFCDVGVVNDGHDGVTATNGSLREFALGMFVFRARNNQVLNISSTRHVFFGMVLVNSTRSLVENGSFSRNIPPEGDGIGLFGSDHLKILGNKVRRNRGPGIHVNDSNENLIKGNVFSRNSLAVSLDRADHNRVRSNRCNRNDACVLVGGSSRNVIARNHIHKGGDGIAIEKGHGNVVARNYIAGPHKSGVYLGLDRPAIGGRDTIVRRNVVRASGKDAFLVRTEDRHSRLKRNVAIGARDDGFEVESRSAKLTRNEAKRNGDLGVEAVRGVIDGGGNRASGNGDLRQCTNIVCS